MSQRTFDAKFGPARLGEIPLGPGVYLYSDKDGAVIYVGKAKSLRRRLAQYRNASKKRVHRKMRTLVREAQTLEVRPVETEEQALLLENQLIQELKPTYNVDGAYAFLYPALGVAMHEKLLLLCFSTEPSSYAALGLSWYGTFRSRPRVKDAFDALVALLSLVGHLEKSTKLPAHEKVRGSRLVGFRQLPPEITEALPWFFAGEETHALSSLARLLIDKPRARREASLVQERFESLKTFYDQDAVRLREALRSLGKAGSFVPSSERDALFIRSAFSERSSDATD